MNNNNLVQFPKAFKAISAAAASSGNLLDPQLSEHAAEVAAATETLGAESPIAAKSLDDSSNSLNNQIFSVCLDDFDGPIDLLLHLVKRNELPIEKLSLAKVADQYMQCINQTIGFDLELAGEYLVIAATLLSIKAALLLDPKADRQIDFDEGPDPHEELLRRLREAEIYQEAAKLIGSKNILGYDVFAATLQSNSSKSAAAINSEEDPGLAQHDSALLSRALKKILAAVPQHQVGMTINWHRISIGERMQFFIDRLQARKGQLVSFEELLGNDINLPILVSSFIALLELCKRKVIQISQQAYNDSIFLQWKEGEQDLSGLAQSEFDVPMQVGNVS